MRFRLLILLMLVSVGASAQTFVAFGSNGIQRRIIGTDTVFRSNGGASGFVYWRSEWYMKQNLSPNLTFSNGVIRTVNDVEADTSLLTTKYYTDSAKADKSEPLNEFNYPSDMTFRPFPIYYNNGKWVSSKSSTELVKSKKDLMKPYYLDYTNGIDSTHKGGTMATAFKTLPYAISQGAELIYLAPGLYKNDGFGAITNTTGKDIFIIGAGKGKTFVTGASTTTPSYTITTSNTYTATISGIVGAVDYSMVDSLGFPFRLKRVASQALAEAEAGTAYFSGIGTVYIHLKDNRAPDANVLLMSDDYKNYYGSNSGYLYIEGVTFMGGASPFYVHGQTTTSTSTLTALFKDVNFLYGRGDFNGEGEGLKSDNVAVTWVEGSNAYGNWRDGYNYKSSNNPTSQKVVEINSNSFWNTDEGASSAINGSSAHNGAMVLRIGGNYHHNGGPNIVDVDQSVTVNIGTKAWKSLGFGFLSVLETKGDYAVGNQSVLAVHAKMYNINVQSGDPIRAYSTQSLGGGDMVVDSTSVKRKGNIVGNVTFGTYTTSTLAPYSFNALSTYTTGYGFQGQTVFNRAVNQIVLKDQYGNDRAQLSASINTGLSGFGTLKASSASNVYETCFVWDGATINSAFQFPDISANAKLSFPAATSTMASFRIVAGTGSVTKVPGGFRFVSGRVTYDEDAVNTRTIAYTGELTTVPTLQTVTTAGSVTTTHIQSADYSAGKTKTSELIESNGAVSVFGGLAAHAASRGSISYNSNTLQLWAHGSNVSTAGNFDFMARASDGTGGSTVFSLRGASGNAGVGVNNPLGVLHLKAGTSTNPIFLFSSGTDLTTKVAGAWYYDGTRLAFSPSTTLKRVILSNDVAPTTAQTLVGNGTDFTVTTATGTGTPVFDTSPTLSGTVVLPSTTSIGTVSSTEIGYVDNVTSPIQPQFNTITSALSTTKTLTSSGTGVATTISIAHGLSGITGASAVLVMPNNAASAGVIYATVDATNVNIVYTVAPALGTNNLLYSVTIK